MPLTEVVNFKIQLQSGNRFQVPTLVRWRYKIETSQSIRVDINAWGKFGVHESFLTEMRKDGRITVPALIITLIKQAVSDVKSVAMDVTFSPV